MFGVDVDVDVDEPYSAISVMRTPNCSCRMKKENLHSGESYIASRVSQGIDHYLLEAGSEAMLMVLLANSRQC
jgi:hypothetical protein